MDEGAAQLRANRDIVVIGASAGGLQPLQRVLRDLPPELPAAVFVVMHLGASSHLATILARTTALPVLQARSGQHIEPGHVYVAVPGLHLLLHDHHILLRRGPRENLARPAIDPLFRSAACSFGGRVIGVVLSGSLNDGTAGLLAIKRCGGVAVVQEPADAAVPEMPLSALRHVDVDDTAPAAGLGALLARLVHEPAGATPAVPRDIQMETAIAAMELAGMATEDRLGTPSRFTCPECHGALWEVNDESLLRYRCHVGHAYTADAMLSAQAVQAEELLWSLMRAHHERAELARKMARQERDNQRDALADHLSERARDYDEDAEVLRRLLRRYETLAAPEPVGEEFLMQEEDAAEGALTEEPAAENANRAAFPVVGIGASAGGIDAMRKLLPAIDPDCGMAFVVVQHLDPDHKSLLSEVLARGTPLPVATIVNDTEVEPNHIYVIPSGAGLTIAGGRLTLTTPAAPRGQRTPIDEFFISLAHDQGENAACVILSGTGSDGTLGLRAVKEHGGLALAQTGAEYDGMMRSAVATGLVDFALPAQDIPAKLRDYFSHASLLAPRQDDQRIQSEVVEHLGQICSLLLAQTGHDFSEYKDRTIVRRVQRRMHVLQIADPAEFVERLRVEPHEITLLFQDLLIGVTNFFRDRDAFEVLEREVIPLLFEGKGPLDSLRVWVPGCATGEEAYSIAILLQDALPQWRESPRLQIFASDIDAHALEVARNGRYPASIAKDVPPKRLERYFVREDGTYRVAGDLREMCLFSTHNLLRDAPFSRLDLVCCRNLLIYLNAGLQSRVVPLFQYALNPGGFLFLGSSENVSRHSRLFATVDKAHRIFRRRPEVGRTLPVFPLSAPDGLHHQPQASPQKRAEPGLQAMADRHLLDRYAPPYVVINAEGEVLQASGRTGRYLELPAGPPDTNIFSMARPDLRADLRAALGMASSSQQAAVQHAKVPLEDAGERKELDLYVQPLRATGAPDPLYMVIFQEVGGIAPGLEPGAERTDDGVETDHARQLEAELRATKERLQTTTEELESSNEELKSSNEELSSINEELQSANEELETSKEELQSINEELQTVNAELNARVEELGKANNDMANLLQSMQIATIFLNRHLEVTSFTPAAKDLFRLVESDTDRPIMHVRPRFELGSFEEDAERVLRTLSSMERQIATDDGTRYMMRVLPYRTVENVISGVVITFTDITRITAAEARIDELTKDLRVRIDDLETLLDLVPVGIFFRGRGAESGLLTNQCGSQLLGEDDGRSGLRPAPQPFRLFQDGREIPSEKQPLQLAEQLGEPVSNFEGRLEGADGHSFDVMISATPRMGENGAVNGAIAAVVNISEHKKAEAQQQVLLHELQHRVKNVLATVGSLAGRMARTASSVPEFHDSFLARLQAMGRMHDLLSGGVWQGADLRSVMATALDSYASDGQPNVALNGPRILLGTSNATTLGMIFHELATNAAKYGALSTPGGNVEVSWKVVAGADAERQVRLTWTERNGPPVMPPGPRGFGTSFLQRSVEYELQGSAELDFLPDGLRCVISFPLAGNVES